MRSAGNVIRADVIVGPDGRSKGLGTVEFSKPYEVLGILSEMANTFVPTSKAPLAPEYGLFATCSSEVDRQAYTVLIVIVAGRPVTTVYLIDDGN